MNNKSVHTNKDEKFLFNLNNFDEDEVEEEEEIEVEPPPPTFSEEELEAARKDGFETGKAEGIKESKASRAEKATNLLEIISADFKTLFEAEHEREKTYERESVALALGVFQKLFPVYQEKCGFDELETAITQIVQKHGGQKQITLAVPADVKPAIDSLLESLAKAESVLAFDVKADDQLTEGSCKIAWKDGGAVKNPHTLAEEIETILKQILAASPANRHDSEETEESGPPDASNKDIGEDSQVVEKPDE